MQVVYCNHFVQNGTSRFLVPYVGLTASQILGFANGVLIGTVHSNHRGEKVTKNKIKRSDCTAALSLRLGEVRQS